MTNTTTPPWRLKAVFLTAGMSSGLTSMTWLLYTLLPLPGCAILVIMTVVVLLLGWGIALQSSRRSPATSKKK